MRRKLIRELALKVLFMIDVGENRPEDALEYIAGKTALKGEEKAFLEAMIKSILEKNEELDELISRHLINWSLDRLAALVRNALRLGLYEILYREDVPVAVAINEAIELTKKYQDEEAARFVNGVLDRMAKKLRGG